MSRSGKITVLIADDIADTRENLTKLLYFEKDIEVVGGASDGQQAVEMARKLNPDIILMDITMPTLDGIAATEAIRSSGSVTQVIIMSVQDEPDYLRRAMLAGAREYLVKPFGGEDLILAIRRVYERAERTVQAKVVQSSAPSSREATNGKIITVYSPKGGVGRTTMACNLAVALRETTKKGVVLVDANMQFGDVGVLLNLQPTKTIVDVLPHMASLDPDLFDDLLPTHSSGVKVLLAPTRPEMAELVSADSLKRILLKLRETYEYVVVDTWPSFQDTMLVALDVADEILLLITMEMPAIKNARIFLDVAKALGYPREKVVLVLNRADSTGGIQTADIERSLDYPIKVRIVSDGRLVTYALNQGVPFVTSERKSPVARGVFELASLVSGPDAAGDPEAAQKDGARRPIRLGGIVPIPWGAKS